MGMHHFVSVGHRLCIVGVFGLALACADDAGSEANFEAPIDISTDDVLSKDQRKGDGYRVGDPVRADGYALHYKVESTHFGGFSASSDYMLGVRVQELRAIGALSQVSRSETFKDAAINSAKSPFRVIKSLVTEPKETLKGAGRGVKKAGTKAGSWIGGDRRERAETEDSAFAEVIGFSRRKRQLAHSLDVDVYSSNPKLQDELDSVCKASISGGLSFAALMAVVPIPPVITLVRHTTGFTKSMNDLIASKSGGDLYKMNREILRGMGFPDERSEAFLNDEQASPRHKTYIVHSMKQLRGIEGIGEVITLGRKIGSEEDALRLQRMVELARSYHVNESAIRKIVRVDSNLLLLTKNGEAVVVLPADRLLWTQQTADLAASLWDPEVVGADVSKRRLWITGKFSDRARSQLANREVLVEERASRRLEAEGSG